MRRHIDSSGRTTSTAEATPSSSVQRHATVVESRDHEGDGRGSDLAELQASTHRRRVSTGLFCTLTGVWLLLFIASGSLQRGPSPHHLGGDYALFLSGAAVLHAGGNPYNQQVLYRAEQQLMRRNGITPPKFDPFMRVGNPPLLFWAMNPLTHGSFVTTAKLWSLGMYVILGFGFWGCLVFLRWRRRWLPLLLFLALPQTVYAAFYGNVDALVFASLAWSAALARTRPYLAGALLVVALLKPQIGLPGAFLIILFMSSSRRRAFAGFVMASAVALALSVAVTGFQYVGWWLDALTGYSQRLGVQPDLASLSGLYIYSASDQVRVALEAASLAAAAAATLTWWLRYRGSQAPGALNMAWLWIVWFLATPFAHFHDEVVLALPALAIVGTDARWLGRWPATLAVFVLLFSILLFPTSRAHTDYQSLTLVIVLACAIAQLRGSSQTSDYADVSPLPRGAEVLSG